MGAETSWFILSASIALFMGLGGYKKKSLSSDGAMCAVLVGTLTFCASLKFGLILIGFFISSSLLTKFGSKKKKKIEAEFKEGASIL